MAEIITAADLPEDLRSAEQVATWLAGANAKAVRVAPCLAAADPAPSPDQLAEAKLVLLGAIERWAEAGGGGVQQQTAGPFSMTTDTTRSRSGYNLWPSEIAALQDLCSAGTPKAFAVDTAPGCGSQHSPICSLVFGATYCSCGADLAGEPLYERVES